MFRRAQQHEKQQEEEEKERSEGVLKTSFVRYVVTLRVFVVGGLEWCKNND